jgi:hypothetical protein
MLAALLADLLAFPLLVAAVEKMRVQPGVAVNRVLADMPYSHSLLMDAIWAGIFAGSYFVVRRYAPGTWLLFAAVLSHWLLDFVSHRPDMGLAPAVPQAFGLGLWNSVPTTLIVEGGFWLLAIIIYVRATRPKKRAGTYGFCIGVVFCTVAWYGNITSGMDPDPARAGISGLIFFSLIVAWAYWINRLRPAAVGVPARAVVI